MEVFSTIFLVIHNKDSTIVGFVAIQKTFKTFFGDLQENSTIVGFVVRRKSFETIVLGDP
jgi:hypothetical protein